MAKGNRTGKGHFKLGHSGNPDGRPRIVREVIDSLRDDVPQLISILKGLAKNSDDDRIKLAAVKELLDRALGRAPQAVDLQVSNQELPVVKVNLFTIRQECGGSKISQLPDLKP